MVHAIWSRFWRLAGTFRARVLLAALLAAAGGGLAAAAGVDVLTRTSPVGAAANSAAGVFLVAYLGLVAAAVLRAVWLTVQRGTSRAGSGHAPRRHG